MTIGNLKRIDWMLLVHNIIIVIIIIITLYHNLHWYKRIIGYKIKSCANLNSKNGFISIELAIRDIKSDIHIDNWYVISNVLACYIYDYIYFILDMLNAKHFKIYHGKILVHCIRFDDQSNDWSGYQQKSWWSQLTIKCFHILIDRKKNT